MKKISSRLALLLLALNLGFCALVSQILLLREFGTVFYGNEMVYALILAGWLFSTGLGSLIVSGFLGRSKNLANYLTGTQVLACFLLPATIAAARISKNFLGIHPGEIINLSQMALTSFILLLPLALIFGAQFSLICFFYEETERGVKSKQPAGGGTGISGTVYFWEAVGSAAGGLVLGLALIKLLPALQIAILVGILNLSAVIFVSGNKSLRVAGAVLAALFLLFNLSGLTGRFDLWLRQSQWPGFTVVAIKDSVYGNLALLKRGNEFHFYENGLLSFSTRDLASTEERIHFALLSAPRPQKILLIGNGLDGSLSELLKYPVMVDYVELDPAAIKLVSTHLLPDLLAPLKDPRVRLVWGDARQYVKSYSEVVRTKGSYDCLIINLPEPYNAQLNRYYTKEFFNEARRILSNNGLLALSVSSSENYLGPEAQQFLRSLNSTLKEVFPEVRSVPGDTNYFLAAARPGTIPADYQVLLERLKERKVKTKYVREYYLPAKFSPGRLAYINKILATPGEINHDAKPIVYIYDIIYWSTHFDSLFQKIYSALAGLNLGSLLFLPVGIYLAGSIIKRRRPAFPFELSIFLTGLFQIVFQVLVLLAFQTICGYAYYGLVLLMAAFMCGLALGSFSGRRLSGAVLAKKVRIYKFAQLGICLLPLLLPLVYQVPYYYLLFTILPVLAGFLGGIQYPLATGIIASEQSAAKSAGWLYGLDVMGAALGALFTGTILVPLLGIADCAVLFAVLNLAVLLLF